MGSNEERQEAELRARGINFLVATDEVGRGPLAGPVVAAAVALTWNSESRPGELAKWLRTLGVTDSKKRSDRQRQKILATLKISSEQREGPIEFPNPWGRFGCHYAIASVAAPIIDQINILQASLQAMRESIGQALAGIESASLERGEIWVDGNRSPRCSEIANLNNLQWCESLIPQGDAKSVLIGLASMIAKVYRDRLMQQWHERFPLYGFAHNAGYPTAEHLRAIATHGVTPIHRITFKGAREFATLIHSESGGALRAGSDLPIS